MQVKLDKATSVCITTDLWTDTHAYAPRALYILDCASSRTRFEHEIKGSFVFYGSSQPEKIVRAKFRVARPDPSSNFINPTRPELRKKLARSIPSNQNRGEGAAHRTQQVSKLSYTGIPNIPIPKLSQHFYFTSSL